MLLGRPLGRHTPEEEITLFPGPGGRGCVGRIAVDGRARELGLGTPVAFLPGRPVAVDD